MKPKFPGVIVSIDENDITAWDIINKCARAATRSGLVGSGWQMIFANQCLGRCPRSQRGAESRQEVVLGDQLRIRFGIEK
jgi:hypothetical protein